MWNSQEDLSSQFEGNPCITGPFLKPNRNGMGSNPGSLSKNKAKKNLHQWLRIQEMFHRIKDSETNAEKTGLYLNLGDRFCDIKRFTEALCAYGQAFLFKSGDEGLNSDCLVHFISSMTKVIETKTRTAMLSQMRSAAASASSPSGSCEKAVCGPDHELTPDEMADKTNWKYYTAKAGDPCADPFSCPSCSGVLYEPVTLPCGHSFCRTHVMSNTANPSLCLKCKAPWRREEPRLTVTPSGGLERQQSTPEDDLKTIATNTLVNSLVTKYWSEDLKVIELRTKANKMYSSGQLGDAMQLYNRAFSLAPDDHLVLSNRSITYLKMGNALAALEDAEMAVALRPDWPKGYLRRGSALKVLGRHEEALQDFFACLMLEQGLAKPVKQELAKELLILLNNKAKQMNAAKDSNSLCSGNSSSSSLDNESNEAIDILKPTDLPEKLQEMANYLEVIAGSVDEENEYDENEEKEEKTRKATWLTIQDQLFDKPFREVSEDAVDSNDYECPLCMRLFWRPVTTPCGHTFCKTCLDRVLDHNTCCPMCKSATLKTYLSERRDTTVNEFVEKAMRRLLPGEFSDRQKVHEKELQQLAGQTGEASSSQVPIFVCTMSFPNVPCPLHVFEPRYRLMIRRCMEVGTREFGMCCYVENEPYADYGTMLEIRDIQFFPDGRSIVDTMGSRRFKVVERNIMDGYNTAKVEFLEDEKIEDDEIEELKKWHDETLQHTKDWMEGMSQSQRKRIVDHYGVLPETEQDYWTLNDGPTWVWWIINILPIDLKIKAILLSMTSLKKRLENTRRILKFLAKARPR